jgi:hypothetical protein
VLVAGAAQLCAAATLLQSKHLGRANLTFRSVNKRFDIVGGLLYYMLVVSGSGEVAALL